MEVLTNPKKKKYLERIKKIRKKTLRRLIILSSKLRKRVKDPNILVKIYYFEALSYYLANKEKKFYEYLKKAEKYAKKNIYKRQIYSRLADYHYNKRQMGPAQKYYLKTIRLPKDRWYPKYLYNLSWTFYSFDKMKTAIKYIKASYAYSKKKGYVDFSDQTVDTVLLFYANSNWITAGVKFLSDRNEKSFDNLYKFLNYTFEHGTKKHSEIVLKELNKLKLTPDQEVTLLLKEMIVYRALKKYPELQEEIDKFAKSKILYKKIKKQDEVKQLINDMKGYTGFLQSLVKNFPDKRKGVFSSYIRDNFNLLKGLDEVNSIEYEYYIGETFFSIGEYLDAVRYYKNAIKLYASQKKQNTKAINKVFDSYFKSLEYLKKHPQYNEFLEDSFKSYIAIFPRSKKAILVFERLISLYFSTQAYKKIPPAIFEYNKYHPNKLQVQQGYFKKLTNVYVKEENISLLNSIKNYMGNSVLKFSPADIAALNTIIYQIQFKQSLALLGNEDEEVVASGIEALLKIYKNQKFDRNIRIDAIVNILKFYYEKNDMMTLSNYLKDFENFLNPSELNSHVDKIKFYTGKFCELVMIKECLANMEFIRNKAPRLFDKAFEEKQFKFLLMNKKYVEAHSLIRGIKVREGYFKQYLLAGDIDTLVNFLKTPVGQGFESKLKNDLENIASMLFMDDEFGISSGALSRYKGIKTVSNKIEDLEVSFKMIKSEVPVLKVKPPVAPMTKNAEGEEVPGQVTFEMFAQFLDSFIKEFQSLNQLYNRQMKKVNHHFSLFIISEYLKLYEKAIREYKAYQPVTTDEELKNAILGELQKLISVLEQKKLELEKVKLKSSVTKGDYSGSNYFNYQKDDRRPLDLELNEFLLWNE